MKIAIIGAGISGLTSAYLLTKHHETRLYEANDYLGGHTATVDITLGNKQYPVDTGFIVFNDWTYPRFIKLLDQLNVASQESEMSFSVTCKGNVDEDFEYCGSSINSLFAKRRHIVDTKFHKMLSDIVRFNRKAKKDLSENRISADASLQDYLLNNQFSDLFLSRYIYPMASAIWSSPTLGAQEFNALSFIRFFNNHGLLNIFNRPKWRVLKGGSRSYIAPLIQSFHDRVLAESPVTSVHRDHNGIVVGSRHGQDRFDQVVFACHSTQALNLLANPSEKEKEVLLGIPYRNNSVVLHTDTTLLPRRRRAWASWNYLIDGSESSRPVLTYNMNKLQGLDCQETVCVSMNADHHINPEKVLRKFNYAHPQFGKHSTQSKADWEKINGVNNTWYCGAYWGNGFHEDGVVSACRVSAALGGETL